MVRSAAKPRVSNQEAATEVTALVLRDALASRVSLGMRADQNVGTTMPLPRRALLRLAMLVAASSSLPRPAGAQAWPSRPLRFLVPFAAGGTTDLIARLMAAWLSERLGQQVIVENKPGGGTNIAVQAAVNAPGDGYTLLFTVATNAINQALYKSL